MTTLGNAALAYVEGYLYIKYTVFKVALNNLKLCIKEIASYPVA
jgi:hypothetical protein